MGTASRVIHVDPDSELGRALENDEQEVILVSGSKTYIVSAGASNSGREFDLERFLQVLNDVAGSISPEEAERWKEHIYRAREEGSRPITRP